MPAPLSLPLVRLALACILLSGIGFGAVGPYQSIIGIERLGLSPSVFALVLGIGSALSALAAIGIGVLGDQTGRHRLLIGLSFALTALASMAMTVAPGPVLFIVVHAVLLPIGSTSLTQTFALAGLATQDADADLRTRSLALVRAGFSATYAVTPPLCAGAVALGADVLWMYPIMGGANLLAAFAVWRFWPEAPPRPKDSPPPLQALTELTSPVVLTHVMLIALIMTANYLPNNLIGLMVVTELGGREAHVGVIAGAIAAVEIPVMLLAASAAQRLGRGRVILMGMAIYGIFLIGLWQAQSMALIWWLILPAGIGAGLILTLPLAVLQDLLADRPGAGGALISVTNVLGMLLAAGLFALGAEVIGLGASAALAAAIAMLAAYGLLRAQSRIVQDA